MKNSWGGFAYHFTGTVAKQTFSTAVKGANYAVSGGRNDGVVGAV